jgi:hypothetical protein
MRPAIIAASAAALFGAALPASAQIQTLPETSRSQGQANSINESLAVQARTAASPSRPVRGERAPQPEQHAADRPAARRGGARGWAGPALDEEQDGTHPSRPA